MAEKPLERLNYYNGQRLEASDLKLEQEYHIRVRRWLNKSLYSAGIARGLEVKARADIPAVVVSPGMALDSAGREIILLEEVEVPAVGNPSTVDGEVDGNYLTIQYREQTIEEELDGCAARPNGHKAGNRLAWGGPARMLAQPVLALSDSLPAKDSGKVVLAQIELDAKCETVRRVHTNVREYVGGASDAKVRQFALEGERDIDATNSKKIYFHVRGRQPKSVTLYLRAEKFSTLYYTELGDHSHSVSVTGETLSASPPLSKRDTTHDHDFGTLVATGGQSADHNHDLNAREGYLGASRVIGNPGANYEGKGQGRAAFFVIEQGWPISTVNAVPPAPTLYVPETGTNVVDILADVNGSITGGGTHTHPVTGRTAPDPGFDYDHKHSLSGSGGTGPAGVTDPAFPPGGPYSARGGDPLTYVSDLQITVDDVPCTAAMLSQIVNSRPPNEDWRGSIGDGKPHLGDGSASHPFAVNGTGPIKLDFLPRGVYFDEGEHVIELSVASGGGRIRYNLYVE